MDKKNHNHSYVISLVLPKHESSKPSKIGLLFQKHSWFERISKHLRWLPHSQLNKKYGYEALILFSIIIF